MRSTRDTDEAPVRAYSRLLLRLHDLIAKEQGDDPEADAVRDQLDAPWYAMTEAEQERVGGLSEDLYALAENTRRSVTMSAGQRRQWGQELGAAFDAADWDRALVVLRHPPDDVPVNHIAYLQADCWDHLGWPEVALRFMRAATRLNAAGVVSVLIL